MRTLCFAVLLMPAMLMILHLAGCSNGPSPSLLQSRVEASFDVKVKVAYAVVIDRGEPGNPVSLSVIQGPWGRRSDVSVATETRTFSSMFLDLGQEQYICGTDIGERGGCIRAGNVFENPGELFADVFDFTFSFRRTFIESDTVEVVGTSSHEVAGLKADCFQVTAAEPAPEDAEICLSDEGILLSLNANSAGTSLSLIANRVDRDVTEADFALPYPIVGGP